MKTAFVLVLAVVTLTACASKPDEQKEVELTAKNAVYLQRMGYTIVNKDGQTLVCQRNATTGTMIQKTTTCLTEAEWQKVDAANRRTLENIKSISRKPGEPGT